MKRVTSIGFELSSVLRASLIGSVLLLAACDGDGRPLEEAVEVSELELRSIQIVQPAEFLAELFVNTNEQISFSVEGVGQSSELIELSSESRRWSVIDAEAFAAGSLVRSSLARIDGNGNFVANNQGSVIVRVQVGGLAANFPVTISNETLVSINQIIGEESIDRCIPNEYSATGIFSAGSTRALFNVDWRLSAANFAAIVEADSIQTITVLGRNPGSVDLIADVNGITAQQTIIVEDTLQAITIVPEVLGLTIDATQALGATGTYTTDSGTRQVAITENVVWTVPESNGVITVSNTSPNIGVVTSDAVGSSRVSAVCGDFVQQKAVVVVDDDDDDDDS